MLWLIDFSSPVNLPNEMIKFIMTYHLKKRTFYRKIPSVIFSNAILHIQSGILKKKINLG